MVSFLLCATLIAWKYNNRRQKTVETMNISPIATYANYTHCSRVSCCRDETTKCLNWFLSDSLKANNCFLPEENSQPPCKSFSNQSVSPFFISHGAVTQCLLLKLHLFVSWFFCPKLLLREKSAVHKNFCCWNKFRLKDLHEFIFARGAIGNNFVSKFKMSLWEKMLLSINTVHFNLTLIRLNNKSSPQFIHLNGTNCRVSKVIVRFI